MTTTARETAQSKIARLEQTIEELEQRIVHLEQSAHTEHTLGPDAVDQLAKQIISRISNGLASLVQTPAE